MEEKRAAPIRWTHPAATILVGTALAATLALAGCVVPVSYIPDKTWVDRNGMDAARDTLTSILRRAQDPRISSVKIKDDCLEYFWERTRIIPTEFKPADVADVGRIYFVSTERLEIYANNNVFLYGPTEENITKILFSSPEDARTFADIFESLQLRRRSAK